MINLSCLYNASIFFASYIYCVSCVCHIMSLSVEGRGEMEINANIFALPSVSKNFVHVYGVNRRNVAAHDIGSSYMYSMLHPAVNLVHT